MNKSQDAPIVATVIPGGAFPSGLPEPPARTFSEQVPHDARPDASTDRLAARIKRVVRRRTSGTIHNLRVEVRRDGVFLDGQCASFYAKQLAQQAAMPLSHDRQITNRIEVR